MLSRRGPILIVVSLLLAVGAAWVANRWLLSKSEQMEATPGTAPVARAATDIPFGTTVEAGRHVEIIQMLEGTVPGDAYTTVTEGRFSDEAIGATLAAVVAPNMRAVSVRVNDVIGVGGFLQPGNHVDIVSAFRDGQDSHSETVVQNVKVLAVDQTASSDKNEPAIVRAVTLEVTPEDAEKLVLAEHRGVIQLALRNPTDTELVAMQTRPAPPAPVPAPAPVVKARPRAKVGPPPPSTDVTVIRGTDVGKEVPPK